MNDRPPMDEQEQEDLVAYLDGELEGADRDKVEAKLSLDPGARAEADTLRRTWELLDYLPRPEPSATFTHRTLERIDALRVPAAPAAGPRRPWRFGLAWAAAALAAGVVGYAGTHALSPARPTEQDLVRDLRVIENKRAYDLAGDVDFLKQLDHPDLFGEDAVSGS